MALSCLTVFGPDGRCFLSDWRGVQVQRIFQLAAYKAKQEEAGITLGYEALADLYNKRVKVSSGELR